MNLLPVFVVAATIGFGDPHVESNPIYAELLNKGVTSQLAPSLAYPLPRPVLPDGMNAAEQKAALEKLVGRTLPLAEFTRNSPVAENITKISELEKVADQPIRRVDVYFVAYGKLETFDDEKQFGNLLTNSEEDAQGHVLTAAELSERGITPPDEQNRREAYGFGTSAMLNKIRLSAVARTYWTKGTESIVAAVKVDPRFINDKKYPNAWSALSRNAEGKLEPGPAQPYDGSGTYVKITKLAEPADALFVEIHSAYVEPHGWFEGRGNLSSKLGLVAKSQVKSFRQGLGQTLPKPPQK